jgi:L-fuculose-phosphate aldolase
MTPDMMCITDLDGRKLQGDRDPVDRDADASRGLPQRPECQAVVHAHPPIATGFAVAGIPLNRAVLAEVLTTLGSIPIAEYATPSTQELPTRSASTSRRTTACCWPTTARSPSAPTCMRRTTRWRRSSTSQDQPGRAAAGPGESDRARRVERLQELRGTYGIKAPAADLRGRRAVGR